MSLYLIPEAWCDGCDHRHQPEWNLEEEELATWEEDFHEYLRGEGWKLSPEAGLHCPDCNTP